MFSKLWFVGSLFVACIEGYGYGGGGGQHSSGGPVIVKVGAPGFSLSGSIKDDPPEKEAEYDAYFDGPAGTGFGFTDELGKLLDKFKGGLKIEKNPDGTPSIKLEGSLNLAGGHHGVHDHHGPHGHYPHHGFHGHHGHHGPYGHYPPYGFHGGYDHFPPHGHHGHHGHPPPGAFTPDLPFGGLFGFPPPFHPHGPHPHDNVEDHINKKPYDVERYKPSSSPHDCEGKCPPEINPHHMQGHADPNHHAEYPKYPHPPTYDGGLIKPQRLPHRKNPGSKPTQWSDLRPEEKPQSNQNAPNIETSNLCDSNSENSGPNGCDLETKPNKATSVEGSEQFPIENGSILDSIPNPLGALSTAEPESIDKDSQHHHRKVSDLHNNQELNHHVPKTPVHSQPDHASPNLETFEPQEGAGSPVQSPALHSGKYPQLPTTSHLLASRRPGEVNSFKNHDQEVHPIPNPCVENPLKCSPNLAYEKQPHNSNRQPGGLVDILDPQDELNPSRPQNLKPGEYSKNQPDIGKPSDDKPFSDKKPHNYANEKYPLTYEEDKLNSELTGKKPYAPTRAQLPVTPQSQLGYPDKVEKDPYHKETQYQSHSRLPEYPTIPSKKPYVLKNPAEEKPSKIYPTYEVPKYHSEHQPAYLSGEYDDQIYYPEEQPALKPSYNPTIQRPQKVIPTQSAYAPDEVSPPLIPISNKPYSQGIKIPHGIKPTVEDQIYPEYTAEQMKESHIPVPSISEPIGHGSKPQQSGEFKPYEPTFDLHSNTASKPYLSNSQNPCGSACDTKLNLNIDSLVAVDSYGHESGNAPENNPTKNSDFLSLDTLDLATDNPTVHQLQAQPHTPYSEDISNHKPYHEHTLTTKPIPHTADYRPKPDENSLAPPKRSYSSNSNAGKSPNQPETGRPNAGLDNVIPKGIRTTLRPPTLATLEQMKEPSLSEDMLESSTEKSLAQLAKEICGPDCWVPSHPDPKPEELPDAYREDYGEYLDYADGDKQYDDSEPIENGEFGGLVVASTTEKLGLSPKAAPKNKFPSSVDNIPVKTQSLQTINPSVSRPSTGYGVKYEDQLQNQKIPLRPASPNRAMPGNQNNRRNQDQYISLNQSKPQPAEYAPTTQDKFQSQKRRMNPMVESGSYKPNNEDRQGLPSNTNSECGNACGIASNSQTTSQPETLKLNPTRNNPFEPKPDASAGPKLSSAMPFPNGSEVDSPLDCGVNCDESTVVESSSISAVPKEDDNDSSEVYDDDGENSDDENSNSENNDGETNDDEKTDDEKNDDENNGGENNDGGNNESENGTDDAEKSETEGQPITPVSQNPQPQLNQRPLINTTPKQYPYQSNPMAIVSGQMPECESDCGSNQQTQNPSPASSALPDEMMNKPVPQISPPTASLDRDQPKKPFPIHPCHGHRKGHHRGHRRCIQRHRIQGHVQRHHGYRR